MNENDYIEMLKERDKPMPMGRYVFKTSDYKDTDPVDICGKCERYIGYDYKFCPVCGQRIDRENYKL